MMGTNGAIAVNRQIYRNMGFDPLTDLAPVALAFRIEHLMAVSATCGRSRGGGGGVGKVEPGADLRLRRQWLDDSSGGRIVPHQDGMTSCMCRIVVVVRP